MLEHNLDGTATEHFPIATSEATLLALLREIFETHWRAVIFVPNPWLDPQTMRPERTPS